ncbi:hypothetical protein KQX54_013290 [Cotesia glomerata]|uniref:Uncharacterized protein n=1 Tax=Cotesia glomerata TaxID=32391 RepID=A0AAV7IYG8_COTGL|nr:hypothetical protein KQX54_013290 [Cotesia glomerata]
MPKNYKPYQFYPYLPQPLAYRIRQATLDPLLIINKVIPRRISPIAPWDSFEFKIDMHIYNETNNKNDTANIIYKNLFYELTNKYDDFAHIYTDVFIKEDQRGCAVVYNEPMLWEKQSNLSIRLRLNKTLILTDSKSVLEASNNDNNSDTRILNIQQKLQNPARLGYCAVQAWVLSHQQIPSNDKADLKAKKALGEGLDRTDAPVT